MNVGQGGTVIQTPPCRLARPHRLRRVTSILCLIMAGLIFVLTIAGAWGMIGLGPAGEYADDPELRQSWVNFILTDVLPVVGPGLIVAALFGTAAWALHRDGRTRSGS